MNARTIATLSACLLATSACSSTVRVDAGGMDAARLDAGSIDAGTPTDTGTPIDSGTPTDAGPAIDSGSDAGPPMACTPPCGAGRACCGGECTNLANDPRNCGECGIACGAGTYCTGGHCDPIPCTGSCGSGETCCGGACCAAGEICCDPQGPIEAGPRCLVPDDRGTCPVGCAPLCACAAPETPIATPDGERPIADLRVGDLVYSVHAGAIVPVPILAVRQNPVTDHSVVRLTLETGIVLEISGRHPTADGRPFDALRDRKSVV